MKLEVRVDRAGGGRGALAVVIAAGRGGAVGVAAAAAAMHRLERVKAHRVEEQQSDGAVGDGELSAGKMVGTMFKL